MQRLLMIWFAVTLALTSPSFAADAAKTATMYKNPQCGCCLGHADYLRRNGYTVKIVETHDLLAVKKRYNIPEQLQGCHTLVIGKYVVEGHVPVKHIDRLIREKPSIAGVSLPGMPEGSQGMGGPKRSPFVIFEIAPGKPPIYAVD